MIHTKILILAADSYLGSKFIKYLEIKQITYIGTYRNKIKRLNKNSFKKNLKKIDNYNNKTFATIINKFRPNTIINFIGSSDRNNNNFDELKKTNYYLIKKILNILSTLEFKNYKFFHIGSSEEYGSNKKAIKETFKCNPNSMYGKSKLLITDYGKIWSKKNKIDFINVRVFNVLGFDKFKKNIVVNLLTLNNRIFEIQQYYSLRDFIDVDDFIIILYKLTINNYNKKFKLINLATGKRTSISKIIDLIKNKYNKKLYKKIKILNTSEYYNYASIDKLKKYIGNYKFNSVENIIQKINLEMQTISRK